MEENKNTEKEIKLDEKVVVKSIAPWVTGARRILTVGDIEIQPNGTVTITREELIAQAQSGNKLLTGIDGHGSHATLYIDDEWTRKELEFETDKQKQNVVNVDDIKKIFDLKTMSLFQKNISDKIVTRAEKVFLMTTIKNQKFNDYEKIKYCETYTGNKL